MIRLAASANAFLRSFLPALAAVAIAASAAASAAAFASQEETIRFRPDFEEGRVSVYEFEANVISETAIEDLKFGGTSATHLIARIEVVEVAPEEDRVEVKLTYDRLAMKGTDAMSGNEYDYDSERDPAENSDRRAALILNRLKESEIIAVASLDGEVREVTGQEGAVRAMERHDLLRSRVGEFSEEGLKQVLEGFWRVGEDDASRSVGESWSEREEMVMSTVGTLIFTTKFSVREASEATAELDLLLEVDIELEKDKVDSEAEEAEPDVAVGEDDPESLVLNPEARQRAQEKAFEESLPKAERADLTSDTRPGRLRWDRERGELIERETYLDFTVEVEQFEIFSQQMQTSVSMHNVESRWRRIGTE